MLSGRVVLWNPFFFKPDSKFSLCDSTFKDFGVFDYKFGDDLMFSNESVISIP